MKADTDVRIASAKLLDKLRERQNGAAFMMVQDGKVIENVTDSASELCEHDCKCGKVWSHGLLSKCRVPREFSPCPVCLATKEVKLDQREVSKNREVAIRNDEMGMNPHNLEIPVGGCAAMSLEELNAHILLLDEKIQELRMRSTAARVSRADKEKELGITDEQRAEFASMAHETKRKSKQATTGVSGASKVERDTERAIRTFMNMGMSREKAEKMAKGDD